MNECPFCGERVVLMDFICPECHHEVREEHFLPGSDSQQDQEGAAMPEGDVEEIILNRFRCAKCGGRDCRVKELAMNGTGLSKLFDIEHHHFLFVSCLSCGSVEVYDPDILRGYKSGRLGTVLDLLFG